MVNGCEAEASFQVAGGGPGWRVAGRGATVSRPMRVKGGRVADASLPERQLGQHAVLPLPRDNLTAGIGFTRLVP